MATTTSTSNGTLSPIPSRSTTPVFMMRPDPSTPRSLTPILAFLSVLDPEATPTHFRPVVPSAFGSSSAAPWRRAFSQNRVLFIRPAARAEPSLWPF